jgi:hypothetical protein
VCAQTVNFFNIPVSKNAGTTHFMLGWRFGVFIRVRNTGCATLCLIFSLNKSVPPIRKKGFYTCRLQKNEILETFLYLAFRTVNYFQKYNLKILNLQRLTYNPEPIQWNHSQVDLIWPDSTFNLQSPIILFLFYFPLAEISRFAYLM